MYQKIPWNCTRFGAAFTKNFIAWFLPKYIDSSTEIISIPESNSVTSFLRIFHVILAVFIKDLKRSWTGNHFDTFGNLGSHWEVQKSSRYFRVFFTSFWQFFIKDLMRSWTGNHFDTFENLGSHPEVLKPSRHFRVVFTSFLGFLSKI